MADPMPRRPEAMKATLTNDVFDDPNWIVERKLDGYRCLAFRDGGAVDLESRNFLSLNGRYPEVAEALEQDPCRHFVIDGEIVGLLHRRSSFEALQQRGHDPSVRVAYYVFDILWLDGEDLRDQPLRERKAALRRRCASAAAPCAGRRTATRPKARRTWPTPAAAAGRA